MLTWLGKTKSEHYSMFSIRKRNGQARRIHNPDAYLRLVQYRLLRNLLDKVPIPDYIYAFEAQRSIPDMSKRHTNKRVVVSVDIKDYFHSITQRMVESLMIRIGLGASAARTVSEICTYKAYVPQGALTSPKLSNLVTALTFGPEIKEFCDKNGFTLTVYADDLTLSSESPTAPVREALIFITTVLAKYGFRVNRSKTKVMTRKTRQYVCGVVVNDKPNLVKKERQRLRAIVHNIGKNGLEHEAAKNDLTPDEFFNRIMGKVNWFEQLNPELGGRLKQLLRQYKGLPDEEGEVGREADPVVRLLPETTGLEMVA